MSFLDQLTAAQREMVVSLPYRVGLWVSGSDLVGGGDASQKELQALTAVLHGFAEETFGSETIQRIISETLKHKDKWNFWATQMDSVPEDCESAIDLMRDYSDLKDVNAFRSHLMEIGEAVALAFQEEASSLWLVSYIAYWKFSMRKGRASRRKKSFREFLRISVGEHRALRALARALGTAY